MMLRKASVEEVNVGGHVDTMHPDFSTMAVWTRDVGLTQAEASVASLATNVELALWELDVWAVGAYLLYVTLGLESFLWPRRNYVQAKIIEKQKLWVSERVWSVGIRMGQIVRKSQRREAMCF